MKGEELNEKKEIEREKQERNSQTSSPHKLMLCFCFFILSPFFSIQYLPPIFLSSFSSSSFLSHTIYLLLFLVVIDVIIASACYPFLYTHTHIHIPWKTLFLSSVFTAWKGVQHDWLGLPSWSNQEALA